MLEEPSQRDAIRSGEDAPGCAASTLGNLLPGGFWLQLSPGLPGAVLGAGELLASLCTLTFLLLLPRLFCINISLSALGLSSGLAVLLTCTWSQDGCPGADAPQSHVSHRVLEFGVLGAL